MHDGHLLQTQDVLLLPGEKAVLQVRLESGSFLRDERNRNVRFVLGGQTYATTVTNREGIAETIFMPSSPGTYIFQIEVAKKEKAESWPQTDLVVSCQEADAPIAIVDLDGTLIEPDFKKVLIGNPESLAQAHDVLTRLAQDRVILYLTHRPKRLGPKSKDWLRNHDFPRGPLLLAETDQLITGTLPPSGFPARPIWV
jgi:phosphatidate phosphatase APP1